MIGLTRLNHVGIVLNSDLIEYIEMTPDTVITLTTGQKLVVLESPSQVVARVVEFRRSLQAPGMGPAVKPSMEEPPQPVPHRGDHGI